MTTLSKQITDQLRKEILQGHYRPGERIEEIPLAEKLGVSRTPVRAALATLATEGLINHQPKRGYTVRIFNLEEIMDAYEVRATLEGMACRIAAHKGPTLKQKEILYECLQTGDQILSKGRLEPIDHGPYQEMNATLHQSILSIADNYYLDRFIQEAQNIPYTSNWLVLWDLGFNTILTSHDDHHRIVNAICAGDGQRAEYLMREHVYFAGVLFEKHYSQQIKHPSEQ